MGNDFAKLVKPAALNNRDQGVGDIDSKNDESVLKVCHHRAEFAARPEKRIINRDKCVIGKTLLSVGKIDHRQLQAQSLANSGSHLPYPLQMRKNFAPLAAFIACEIALLAC